MNCKHIKELLPLYVGRDLEESREQMVTAHLQSCVQCAASATEFREARQLMQQFTPPPFSDAVYTGIRRRVLREIDRESSAPALSQLFSGLFSPRVIWAGSTVMALAVFVFAFYFIANRANNQPDGPRAEKAHANVLSPGKKLTTPSIKQNDGPARAGQKSGWDKTPLQTRRRKVEIAHNRQGSAVNNPNAPLKTAGTLPASNNSAAAGATPPRDSTTSEKPLRMEIQTSDRNIRIIWFTHQGT